MPLPNLNCSCEEFCLHCLCSDYRPLRTRKEWGEIVVRNWTIKPKIKKKKARKINIGVVAYDIRGWLPNQFLIANGRTYIGCINDFCQGLSG